VSNTERRARRLLRWYPRPWRENHDDEFVSLLEDSLTDRPFWPGRSLNIALPGIRLRSRELRTRLRRTIVLSSVPLVVLVAAVAFATNGFGLLAATTPTKGGMPYSRNSIIPYNNIPDYLSVYIGPNEVGYTPKAYVTVPDGSRNAPLLGLPMPVYASNLTTLLGHEYSGIGYVPLGTSPWTQHCGTETVTQNGPSGQTTRTIPCQSVTLVLPNVVGMVTPTAVGELSGLGVEVVIQNVHSRTISPGHIVSTSPRGGSTVHARQPVVVEISVPNGYPASS
jgi:hypothetical protein